MLRSLFCKCGLSSAPTLLSGTKAPHSCLLEDRLVKSGQLSVIVYIEMSQQGQDLEYKISIVGPGRPSFNKWYLDCFFKNSSNPGRICGVSSFNEGKTRRNIIDKCNLKNKEHFSWPV